MMDPHSYKTLKVSRGLTYSYYFSPAVEQPTLLFLHGFPSTSYDWRHQINFFKAKGYGVVAPDLLGYGGTDKALDTALYTGGGISKDVLDILDKEKLISGVICVSHDWGTKIGSRLASTHGDRFAGFVLLSTGYIPPTTDFDLPTILTTTKQVFGYELIGYFLFFASDEAAGLIEAHWDSFFSIVFTDDPELWKTDLAPTGALKQWLLEDRQSKVARYLTDEERTIQLDELKKHGIKAALNWYKAAVSGLETEDNKSVPIEKYAVTRPVLLLAAKHDPIGIPSMAQKSVQEYCSNSTVHILDTGHWVQLEAAEEVNAKMEDWLKTL